MTNDELAKLIAGHKCNTADGDTNCKVCPFLYCGACNLNVVNGWLKIKIQKFREEKKAADGILNFKCGEYLCDDCVFRASSILMADKKHTSCIKDFLKYKIEQNERKYGDSSEDSGSEGYGGSENNDK